MVTAARTDFNPIYAIRFDIFREIELFGDLGRVGRVGRVGAVQSVCRRQKRQRKTLLIKEALSKTPHSSQERRTKPRRYTLAIHEQVSPFPR